MSPVALTRAGVALAFAVAALACGHAAPSPEDPGAAEYYRARLAKSSAGNRSSEYRDGLESAEFINAKRKETILALRTFLSEFPDGPHQREARTLLESLRWNQAVAQAQASSPPEAMQALQGFLADEPQGAHAGEACARIAALQLEQAMQIRSAPALREWLSAHPGAAGRDRAARELEDAEFLEATQAPLRSRRELLQAFLSAHPEGTHRAEAEALEARTSIDEAALLGDEDELRAWVRSGNPDASRALLQLEFEDAASRLDVTGLSEWLDRASAQLDGGPAAEAVQIARARTILLELKHLGAGATKAIANARALHLPALRGISIEHPQDRPGELPDANSGEAPTTPRDRARAMRELALSLDGRALPRLFAGLSAQHVWAAQSALEAARFLIRSLPIDELQLRAARAAAVLSPIAQDGPHLGALALALLAEGEKAAALVQARTAAARDPRSILVQELAAMLESELGDRSLALGDARALASAVRASIAIRSSPAAGEAGVNAASRAPDTEEAPTLWALCAALEGARVATDIVGIQTKIAPTTALESDDERLRRTASEDTRATLASAERAVAAIERASHREGACLAERSALLSEAEREGNLRAQAAAALLSQGDLAGEALARARMRDPSPATRAILSAPAWTWDATSASPATIAP